MAVPLLRGLGRSAALPEGVFWLQVTAQVCPHRTIATQNCSGFLTLRETPPWCWGVDGTNAPASAPSDSPVLRYDPSQVEPNACRGDCASIPYLFSLGQPPNKQLLPTTQELVSGSAFGGVQMETVILRVK